MSELSIADLEVIKKHCADECSWRIMHRIQSEIPKEDEYWIWHKRWTDVGNFQKQKIESILKMFP